MKSNLNNIFTLTFFFLTATMSFAQLHTTDSLAIVTVMKDQENAWNKADIEGFMEGYWKSDSLRFIGSKGITYGWKATIDNYKKNYPDAETMGLLHFSELRIQIISSEIAFVFGKWHLQRSKGDVGGYFTLLWRKINGNWRIVIDHTS